MKDRGRFTEEEVRAHYDAHPEFPRPAFLGPQIPPPTAPQAPRATRGTRKDETLEAEIEAGCVAFMGQDGWSALKTDPCSDRGRAKGFGVIGMADFQFARPLPYAIDGNSYACDFLRVEFKRRQGRVGEHQLAWHNEERRLGFRTWIAKVDFAPTLEAYREHYAASGLMRRRRWW